MGQRQRTVGSSSAQPRAVKPKVGTFCHLNRGDHPRKENTNLNMAATSRIKSAAILVLLVAAAALVEKSAGATYLVGDSMGWTIPSAGAVSYASWAAKHTFRAGDILVFNFPTGVHDVAEVDKASFDSCSATNPSTLATVGPANLTLSAGEAYYICTFGQHCSLGQKLALNVSGASTPSPSPSTPAPAPKATPSPSTTPTPTAAPPTPTPAPPTPTPAPPLTSAPTTPPAPTPATPSPSPTGTPTPALSPTPSPSTSPSPSISPLGASPPQPSGTSPPPGAPAPATEPPPNSAPATATSIISVALVSVAVSILC